MTAQEFMNGKTARTWGELELENETNMRGWIEDAGAGHVFFHSDDARYHDNTYYVLSSQVIYKPLQSPEAA